ncbi:uncharacterized protein LOC106086832 isoform X1 [Stomoxys calcitrans]|uniref:uncharacterized protein LOC106086832 isoform X1 n=1 Tax=Stomoxys calcitrans TaxID=35570 RepID=UPI0027E38772|nr:uncharacterized protein LOC106086832 isoform X1 [Stomoxys calcitrans]XP_059217184.1 uncharacterized protein LOC106086832 isoform X1 [Stomoxys calcitrans]
MNGFVHNLPPPPQLEECANRDLQGVLEIEVSHISLGEKQRKSSEDTEKLYDTTPAPSSNNNKSLLLNDDNYCNNNKTNKKNVVFGCVNEIHTNLNVKKINEKHSKNSFTRDNISNCGTCVQVKIVWFGERSEDAANIFVSCGSSSQSPLKSPRSPQQHFRKKKYKHCCQPFVVVSTAAVNNKLRYRICTCGALFLDYLRSCKPIQIIVSSSSTTSTNNGSWPTTTVLGQAQLRLPSVLLRKFSFNIAKGHNNFEHKTKIYTLYKKLKQQQQHQTSSSLSVSPSRDSVKSGEIQLRFKMMFAPAAAGDIRAHAHDTQTWCPSEKLIHHHHHHTHMMVSGKSKVTEHVVQGEKSKRLSSQAKSEEIVEAMKKLDAKLVAYLAGETEITSKHHLVNCEQENEVNLNLEQNDNNNNNFSVRMDDLSPATKLNIFKSIKGIKIEMEALTLQPEGTKCMDLMQNEIRPIFTVECQLSNELIRKVPRCDMFHLMQFESEKFHSLTQCTRFGQEDERSVILDLDENDNELDEVNLGRLYFTVWWREPGTCLNEMLGMGVLELSDLYNASLLEQCKRIEIQRRDRILACLYFKIILQRDLKATSQQKSSVQMKREIFLPKQSSCDSGDEKSPSHTSSGKQNKPSPDAIQSSAQSNLSTDKTSTEKACAQNNNTTKLQLAKTNFDDETSKIRLLKGFIYANEARNLEMELQPQKILICRRFWLDSPAATKADDANKFNYQEQFSVINDEKFLQRVEKQYLHLELWHRMSSDDGNGNRDQNMHPIGVVRIPLHQFFIAYRDAAITNHLCKGKLPVISIDSWAPIINWQTGSKIGELKCLLAVGSEEQIRNLKDSRGLASILLKSDTKAAESLLEKDVLNKLQPLQISTTSKNSNNSPVTSAQSSPLSKSVPTSSSASKIKKTSDLLDMLQKVLMTPQQPPTSSSTTSTSSSSSLAQEGTNVVAKPNLCGSTETMPHTSSASSTALKPLQPSNLKLFKFALEIQKAIGLPLNPASKSKKGSKQRNASKRFPPNEPPSTYVTFQAEEGSYPTYKSHEGMVFATNVVEKSAQPQWQQRFRLSATVDYLNNPQKRFILKVWKKSALDILQGRNQPTPMEDAIMGFAALDLTAFSKGLHIAGRFNIVDFNGRINGLLEIRCQPLEDIPIQGGAVNLPVASTSSRPQATGTAATGAAAIAEGQSASVDAVIDQFEQTLDLTHLNLGQAIKRKFTELEGISQRLRARLGDITGTDIPTSFNMEQFDSWRPVPSDINDNDLDEFENDLNTPPAEEEEEDGEQLKQEKFKTDNKISRNSQGNRANDNECSSE